MAKNTQSKYAQKGGRYTYSRQFQEWDKAVRESAPQHVRDELAKKHEEYCRSI